MKLSWFLVGACGLAAVVAACSGATGGAGEGTGGSAGAGATAGVGASAGVGGSGGVIGTGGTGGGSLGGSGGYSPTDGSQVVGTGADQGSPGKFGGAEDGSAKITIVYPETGILVPPNMNALDIHFKPAAGQTLFEITYESPSYRLTEYVGCEAQGQGCAHTVDKSFWQSLGEKAKGGEAVWYRIRGVNGASPGAVGSSDWQKLWIAQEPIIGGIYYWNTGGAIQRYDFGYPVQQAEQFLTPVTSGSAVCIGCHVLTRDGTKIAFVGTIPNGGWKVFDVATRTVVATSAGPLSGAGYSYFTFSADGTKLLASGGAKIDMIDVATKQVVSGAIQKGTQPDWAPGSNKVVFAAYTGMVAPSSVQSAGLATAEYQNGAFANAHVILPFDGANNYYPAFSPDSQWILFNRSPANVDSLSNGSPSQGSTGGVTSQDGELWLINQNGGTPVHLAAANGKRWTSWAKWAPGLYTYANGRTAMFFTYSTDRAYGLRLIDGERVQLWMSAVDADLAAAGADSSFPPFHLPFQAITGGNHIAQWVTSVARTPCTTAAECGASELCDSGKCYPNIH